MPNSISYSLNIQKNYTKQYYRQFTIDNVPTIGVLDNESYEVFLVNNTDQNVRIKLAVDGEYKFPEFEPNTIKAKDICMFGGLSFKQASGIIHAEVYAESITITQPITTQTWMVNNQSIFSNGTYYTTTTDYLQPLTTQTTTGTGISPLLYTLDALSPLTILTIKYIAWEEIVKRVQLNEDLSLLQTLPPNTHITAGRFI